MQAETQRSGGVAFTVSLDGLTTPASRVAMNRPLRSSVTELGVCDKEILISGSNGPERTLRDVASVASDSQSEAEGTTPVDHQPRGNAAATAAAAVGNEDWVYVPPPDNQRSFYFPEDGLYFTSEFDSGNLIQMERTGPLKYNLYSCPDCGNSPCQTNNRQWFHFAVRGGVKGTTLQLQMVGQMVSKMYSFGWTPVAAVCPSRPVYQRVATRVVVQRLDAVPPTPGYPLLQHRPRGGPSSAAQGGGDDDDDGAGAGEEKPGKKEGECMNVSFEYRFDCDVPVDPQYPFGHPLCPAVYIASNHPYSCARLQKSIAAWRQAAESQQIYFHTEGLTRTLDGRVVDLITISGSNGMWNRDDAREPPYAPGIPLPSPLVSEPGKAGGRGATPTELTSSAAPFGDAATSPPMTSNQPQSSSRPAAFPGKRYVLLTARVHPGEAPASHMLQGALDFLLVQKDPRAAVLLKHYVFVVVPMLNPDGVARGHSRADTIGQNLNRMYRSPHPVKHPTIYAVRQLMLALQATGRLALFIDMHAHANKRGAFFFGNAMNAVDQIQNLLYAKLVSLNTPHLEFSSCNFSQANMFAMGKNGETKDGSSRVTIFQETGFVHSYTIETSYVTGTVQNPIAANPSIPGEEIDVMPGTPAPKYNQATFADVGKALLVSLLDLNQQNPCSRLPNGQHRSLRGVVQWLQRQLAFEVFEWWRRQPSAGLLQQAAAPLASPQPAAVQAKTSAVVGGGFNPETVSPLSLSLSTLQSMDIVQECITTKSSKTMPPVTVYHFSELVTTMRREQSAATAAGVTASSSLKSAPPVQRQSSFGSKMSAQPLSVGGGTAAGGRRSTLTSSRTSGSLTPAAKPAPKIRRQSVGV